MGELTNRVSNGPDSFFDGKAVTLEGCCIGSWCLITCGRDVGRNGKVSWGDFNYRVERQKTKMGELTNWVSNGPDSFFTARHSGRMLRWSFVFNYMWEGHGEEWKGQSGQHSIK